MTTYIIIIEVDDGFTIAEIPEDLTPEAAATEAGGVLVEGGPYKSFADASDVLAMLPSPYERWAVFSESQPLTNMSLINAYLPELTELL